MSNSFENFNKEDIINSFIDDLNAEKKPRAYEILEENDDEELRMLFETVRAVKRVRVNKRKNNFLRKNLYKFAKITAIAATIIMMVLVGSVLQTNQKYDNNIVYAMEKAYEELISYSGIIEIKTEQEGNVDFVERIDVKYKKPYKYVAIHSYDGYTYKNISDGEKLYTIDETNVTVDYSNPKKELWRYHIENQIAELKHAKEIEKVGTEVIVGREATVYRFRYDENEKYHRIWVDNDTNLPLKKELNLNDNRRLVNQFIKIKVNSNIPDSIFEYKPETNKNIVQINTKTSLEEVTKSLNTVDKLNSAILKDFDFVSAIQLQNEMYDYLLKYKGENEDFIDVYISTEPVTDYFIPEAKHGKLSGGFTEIQKDVVNVFKVYIGYSNVAKWVTPEFEMLIVSNVNVDKLKDVLELTANEKITDITNEELEKMDLKPSVTKEGH